MTLFLDPLRSLLDKQAVLQVWMCVCGEGREGMEGAAPPPGQAGGAAGMTAFIAHSHPFPPLVYLALGHNPPPFAPILPPPPPPPCTA